METTGSEFGRGLCYNLGLFLAHAERNDVLKENNTCKDGFSQEIRYEMWFNGSSDHLSELDIVDINLPQELKNKIESFRGKCLKWGHGFPEKKATREDVIWAVQEAKDLLREIDMHFGITTCKGSWE